MYAGCVEGFIANMIFKNISNVQIIGLEYTKEALNIAKMMNDEIDFIQGDIYEMPFEDGFFDVVLCTEVLEHLQDPEMALRELLRVSGNVVFLTVPHEPWFCMGNLMALKNIRRLGNPIDHINHWTYRRFLKFVTATAGYRIWRSDRSFPWSIVICKK